jgi:hypothetical protein
VVGPLGATPFSRCVEAAPAGVVARTPVPAEVTEGAIFEPTDFARGGAGARR